MLSVSRRAAPGTYRYRCTEERRKQARGAIDELAAASAVSIPTVKRPEAQDGLLGGRNGTIAKIRHALEAAGIEFIDENGGGPGVRLRKPQR